MDWIPRLTPFELEALPRAVESSREDISLTAHSLTDVGQEVKCPICLELMENVMVTECLHRFCKDCIVRHLRQMGQKRECPICRVNIRTGRSLRKDERMDALVALFFPGGRAAAAKAKEEASASFKRSDISAAAQRHQQMVAIMREKAKAAAQRNLELQRVAAAAARAEAEARAKIAAAEAASRKRSREEQEEIAHSTLRGRIDNSVAFALRQYPGERVLKEASVGEIRTSGNATVLNLKSFIRAILEVSNPGVAFSSSQIEIILSVPGGRTHASSTAASCSSSHSDGATSFKLIDNQLSLGALHKFFGDQNISPVLIYRTTTGVINPVP